MAGALHNWLEQADAPTQAEVFSETGDLGTLLPATGDARIGGRQRFIDVAVRLFTQRSFAGTSLQMIADEVGVTKS